MITDEDVEDFLAHFGVKGMKWGVRKDSSEMGYRLQSSNMVVDSSLHTSTKTSAQKVALMMNQRYGFNVSSIKDLRVANPTEYSQGTVGYVQSTPGIRGGSIYIRPEDLRKSLNSAEDIGWFGKGTGTVEAFVTHESAHAMFHAEQSVKSGFLKAKVVGGNIKARDKALKAGIEQAKRDGISLTSDLSKISGYAKASGTREEVEAELFSQYHWGLNPPAFVNTWGQTLHKEMGIDATPFKETTKDD